MVLLALILTNVWELMRATLTHSAPTPQGTTIARAIADLTETGQLALTSMSAQMERTTAPMTRPAPTLLEAFLACATQAGKEQEHSVQILTNAATDLTIALRTRCASILLDLTTAPVTQDSGAMA